MTRRLLPVEQILGLLSETAPRIAVLTDGMTPDQLRAAPEPGEWSATEVLAHVRACADLWGGRIITMLSEDHPTIRARNPRTWIEQTDYREQPFATALQAFTAQRDGLLAALRPLAPAAWSRTATLTGAGRPLEIVVHAEASYLATHERTHVKQIAKALETARAQTE